MTGQELAEIARECKSFDEAESILTLAMGSPKRIIDPGYKKTSIFVQEDGRLYLDLEMDGGLHVQWVHR
jgi:hypothetical protein